MQGGKQAASIIRQLPWYHFLCGLVVFGVKIGQLRILTAPSNGKTLLHAAGSLLKRGTAARVGVKIPAVREPGGQFGVPYLDLRTQGVAGELEPNLVVALKHRWEMLRGYPTPGSL